MNSRPPVPQTVAFWLVFCAVVANLISIAASHILIALALVALVASRTELRFPPVKLPLGLFFLGTVISLAFSADPTAGLPQIRKFYVFLVLLLVYSAFRSLRQVNQLGRVLILVGTASGFFALVQFLLKYREAAELGVPFYQYYVGERIIAHVDDFGPLDVGDPILLRIDPKASHFLLPVDGMLDRGHTLDQIRLRGHRHLKSKGLVKGSCTVTRWGDDLQQNDLGNTPPGECYHMGQHTVSKRRTI